MLLIDIFFETANIIGNQPEAIVVKEKMDKATGYVVEKAAPAMVVNSYTHLSDVPYVYPRNTNS